MKIKMKAILVSPPQKQLLHIPLRLCLTRFSKVKPPLQHLNLKLASPSSTAAAGPELGHATRQLSHCH